MGEEKINTDNIIVETHNLKAAFGSKVVWQNANLEIKSGELIGLLGANGSGKTTLFRIILGLQKAAGGKIELFGRPPSLGNRLVGYVPQRRMLDQEDRIASIEYVRLGLYGNKWGIARPSTAQHERQLALKALARVDGKQLAEAPLNVLSGGEQQKVYLAQATIGEPRLLLLDEPLANLDFKREAQLLNLVSSITKRSGAATLLIAHDINPLLPYVDRIIYIAGGRIMAGKPEEIITTENLSALYNAPIEVLKDSKGRLAVLGVVSEEHHAE